MDPTNMSKKTYKKAVAKQRRIKKLRKMKLRDRDGDIPATDVPEISYHSASEESQKDWLDNLGEVNPPTRVPSDPNTSLQAQVTQTTQRDILPPKPCPSRTIIDSVVQFGKTHPKTIGLSLSAIVIAVIINRSL
ncbi:unnamed protein product [Caenorhabditis bovis]|uniref:Uncharacterized protein n=1 Tax=Caenorhabditis bovis TaxID=2654633 RepID=A0A8S1EQ54_9PELO|nr:unnamed protein product [Caenorhabditis bovis]